MQFGPELRVLYVDDDVDLTAVVVRSLKLDPAMIVHTVDRGAKALQVLEERSWQPDVVLLDVMMPDLDGPSTLERIVELTSARLPVIFFTARAQSSDVVELAKTSAIGVMTKPFNPLTLAREIRDILSKSYSK